MFARRTLLSGSLGLAVLGALSSAARADGFFEVYEAASFTKAMQSNRPVLVHVHATWCSTCLVQARVLNELLTENMFKTAQPIMVDYDKDLDFKTAYKAPNRSTIILYKNGKEIVRVGSVSNKDDLRATLLAALDKSA